MVADYQLSSTAITLRIKFLFSIWFCFVCSYYAFDYFELIKYSAGQGQECQLANFYRSECSDNLGPLDSSILLFIKYRYQVESLFYFSDSKIEFDSSRGARMGDGLHLL